MSLKQTQKTDLFVLPLSRIFIDNPGAKILDCFLSNYQLEQKVADITTFTGMDRKIVVGEILNLVHEEIIKKVSEDVFITNFKSHRLEGIYAYYRSTLDSNFSNIEFKKI